VHTDNNYTDADKAKLTGIEAGAEVNVQSDWSQSDSSADDYIKNKPTIPSGNQLVPSATSSDEDKVLTVDSNGDPVWAPSQGGTQLQANWAENDVTDVTYIRNKPVIPSGNQLVPSATSSDEDKVLTVDINGDPVWAPAQGGTQVQSDWSQTDSTAVDYIKNKPQNLVQDASYVHTDNNFTTADKTKLDGIASGAEVNVQSDWSVSDSSSDAYILNKPTIPSGSQLVPSATSSDEDKVLTVDSNGDPVWAPAQGGTQVQSNWTESDSTNVSYIQNKPATINLIAGTGITITETAQGLVISLS
jgi:hypothetical protein